MTEAHEKNPNYMKFKNILTVAYFALAFYTFSAGTIQGLANYPAWKSIGAAEFPAVLQTTGAYIVPLFVPFAFLIVPVSILMIWFRNPAMSRNLVIIAALLNLFIFIVTATLALPIQAQLVKTKSVELIDRLIFYHTYFRAIPGLLATFINCILLYQILRKASA